MRFLAITPLVFAAACGSDPLSGTTCEPDGRGCECSEERACLAPYLCSADGVCALPDCTPGERECTCTAEGECDEGLSCTDDGRCLSAEGREDGPCFSNNTCEDGLKCVDDVCEVCELGSEGCDCTDAGGCSGDLTCEAGTCSTGERTTPPEDPVCYSPCKQGFSDADGKYRDCSPEGLMEGCLDGRSCVEGSCVTEDEPEPPECETDVECPDYQTCIQARCYAECSADSDCSESRRCHRHVCRLPCSANEDTCGDGYFCSVTDAEHGFCLPLRAQTGTRTTNVAGTFQASTESLALTNIETVRRVVITNDAPRSIEFTLSKVEETTYGDDGPIVVTEEPLPFLTLGASGAAEKQASYEFLVEGNGGTFELEVGISEDDADDVPSKWEGVVEVSSELGTKRIALSYTRGPDGRWAGKIYYFTQFGDRNLEAWRTDRNDGAAVSEIGNAFMQKWADLRQQRISISELQAVITSTVSESWSWSGVQQACTEQGDQRCYPNARGVGVYTNDPNSAPIPMGSVEFPMALDLRVTSDVKRLVGRIPSSEALHYAGNPSVELVFGDNPTGCSARNNSACIAFLDELTANVVVGGRYQTTSTDSDCSRAPNGFGLTKLPFIVQGFTENTTRDETTGLLYRYECRDTYQPLGPTGDVVLNQAFAGSNPIPDGRSRVRRLELVDGALVNQEDLYVIFREHFDSFLGDDTSGFSSYGLMHLRRGNTQLATEDFTGNPQSDDRTPPEGVLGEAIACPADLVEQLLGAGSDLSESTASDLTVGLINGRAPTAPEATPLSSGDVHYLCHDTGLFDLGPNPTGVPQSCPVGSGVTFFTGASLPPLDALPCQESGNCGVTLSEWERNLSHGIVMNPVWRCQDANQVYCDTDRTDLRNGKLFFAAAPDAPVFVPLLPAIDDAFRYKTRFRNREGTTIGFAPQICRPNSNAIPYCYDPPAIEQIKQRVDCLTYVFSNHYEDLSEEARDSARSFLRSDFSCDRCDVEPLPPDFRDGFERLYAELLVMLGDESYTGALKSRFDLAESGVRAFEGSKFEPPNGIDLSGVAGFEMYKLYQAAQYYELVLDRFYSMSPYAWDSIANGGARNFITQRTVTLYFNRVLRASTQRARTWSEIGKRYQSMNRPDLARRVVERAYTSAYIEAIALSRMMQSLVASRESLAESERQQVEVAMSKAATTYRAALLDMREVYAQFTDEVTYFGFPPDYIPMPALEPSGPNAFETILAQAQEAASTAGAKEDLAIDGNRSFDTDSAAFQSELTTIRNTYENELASICGTFTGEDGIVYPAIRKYGYLSERTRVLGNPCGFVGNGTLHEAMANLENVQLDVQGVMIGYARVRSEIQIERDLVSRQCGLTAELADYRWTVDNKVNDLQEAIRVSEQVKNGLDRGFEAAGKTITLLKCAVGTSTDCPAAGIAAAGLAVLTAAHFAAVTVLDNQIAEKNDEIDDIRAAQTRWETLQECQVAQASSEATIKGYLLGLKELDLEALKTNYQIRLALSQIEGLRNQATRLAAEQEETEQLAINLEAARNDPNVRIYKNDAVLNADRTFYSALSEAYRATKVFEYYTSQSYAGLVRLGLIRLVSRGDYNLENYLADLDDAYSGFLEEAGRPDLRVDVLSLRDDVLQISRYSDDGRALTESERVELFRAALTQVNWLDANGHRVFPFATALSRLSPLTRNHKITYIEAEVIGSSVGDPQGRVYLSQNGTSTVHALDDSKIYYRFPPRLAVVNPFFNGVRVFNDDVYRNDRLRDRPYVNSSWDLVLNQRDELVNEDIDLNSLTDIRVFVYYNDFTAL